MGVGGVGGVDDVGAFSIFQSFNLSILNFQFFNFQLFNFQLSIFNFQFSISDAVSQIGVLEVLLQGLGEEGDAFGLYCFVGGGGGGKEDDGVRGGGGDAFKTEGGEGCV